MQDFITLNEAAKLLPRRKGKRVWKSTVKRWGKKGCFPLYDANGWKVRREEFLQWAFKVGKLIPALLTEAHFS